ncbi:hypothetical protein GCM10009528_32300 [Kineococcus aurantiacus]
MAYDDRADWHTAAIAFLDEGARAGDRLLYTGDGTVDELTAALAALPGRDELLASGRLTLTRTIDSYGPPETFDADVQSAAYARAGRNAKTSGHRALRVAADMSPVATGASALRRLVAYELAVDAVVAAEPLITLCGYDVHRIGTAGRAVIAAHPVRCGTDVPPFSVTCRENRIVIGGEVDTFDVTEFGEALDAAALVADDPVRIDLSELSFLDAGATRRLAQFVGAQGVAGREVLISGAHGPARLCLSTFGLTGDAS